MMAGAFTSASSTVCPSAPGAPLLRTTFNSALARLASVAASSSSRLVSAALALGPVVFLRFALCSRKLRRSDASERSSFPPPRRAVGEHEAQLSWSLLSQSISSFAPLAFASLLAPMRRSRAVQRSQLSPICNSFQVLDATGVADDSAGRKSLNLCEATESMGGRLEVLEVLGAVSGAARHNP